MRNTNQETAMTIDIDAEYVAICQGFQKIGNAINPNPETLAAGLRALGAAAVLFESVAARIDMLYREAKNLKGTKAALSNRVIQLEDQLENARALVDSQNRELCQLKGVGDGK